MTVYDLARVSAERAESGKRYREFLRVPSLSAGLYELPAHATDPQQPHAEDEIYCVVRGRAVIQVEGQDHPVAPGSVIFVKAGDGHRFHTITEDLSLLVMFAPAEGTVRRDPGGSLTRG